MSDNAKGIFYASTTAFLFGLVPIALKYALAFTDTLTVIWFRFLVAFVLITIFFVLRRPSDLRRLRRPPLLMVAAGLGLGLNYLGFMKGVELTGPENSAVLIQSAPLIFAIIGVFFFGETLSRMQVIGVVFATLGFGLFYRELLAQLLGDGSTFQAGSLWVMLGAVTWAAYATFHKILVRKWQPQQVNVIVYLIAALMFFPMAESTVLMDLGLLEWAFLVFLGIITLVAYGCFAEAVKYISAPKVSIIITLNPILTLLIMALLSPFEISWIESRSISLPGYLGAACVIGGAILVAARRPPLKRKQRTDKINE